MSKILITMLAFVIIQGPIYSYSVDDLFDAIRNDSLSDVKLLIIDQKVDIDSIKGNNTPLMYATYTGNKEILQFLLDNGANINICCDDNSSSALTIAVNNKSFDIVELLINHGADVNHKYFMPLTWDKIDDSAFYGQRNKGTTILMVASANGYNDLIKLLLKNNANIDDYDDSGYTALLYAIVYNQIEAANILISNKANVNYNNNDNKVSPFLMACAISDINTVKLMYANGADILLCDKDNDGVLFYAQKNEDINVYLFIKSIFDKR
jgi:ankyrin repeat protein